MRMPRPSYAPRRAREALLVAALALSSCGGGPGADARVLSEVEYLAVVKRGCLAAKRAAEQTGRESAVPAVYLQRAAEAAEAMQREFAKVRPPVRLVGVHRESLRLGGQQLELIRTAIGRLRRGEAPQTLAGLQARNRQLLRRANEIADELGVPECVNDLGGL